MLGGIIDLCCLELYHFPYPWPLLEVVRSAYNKTCWLHFLAYFSGELCYVGEAEQVEHPDFAFEWDVCNQGK